MISNHPPPDIADHQERYEFLPNANSPTTIYQGYAERGVAPSTAQWSIAKTTLTTLGGPSLKQWATSVKWDDRTTSTYT